MLLVGLLGNGGEWKRKVLESCFVRSFPVNPFLQILSHLIAQRREHQNWSPSKGFHWSPFLHYTRQHFINFILLFNLVSGFHQLSASLNVLKYAHGPLFFCLLLLWVYFVCSLPICSYILKVMLIQNCRLRWPFTQNVTKNLNEI